MNAIAEISQLKFAWRNQDTLLDIPYFKMEPGERVLLSGPSGSGKTTLLGLMGGALTPQQGEIRILGKSFKSMKPAVRGRFRADHIGFLLPTPNLVPYLSALDNVVLACQFSHHKTLKVGSYFAQREAACRLLIKMGMQDQPLWFKKPADLTQFQQQQVMFARALLGEPELIIADEPTIEAEHRQRVLLLSSLLHECNSKGISLIFASSSPLMSDYFDLNLKLNETPECTLQMPFEARRAQAI